MPLSDYLAQIRSSCPKLTDKETNLFAKGLEVQTLAPDDIFLRVGDVPQSVAYVSKGLIKAVYTDFEGSRVNVNFSVKAQVYATIRRSASVRVAVTILSRLSLVR